MLVYVDREGESESKKNVFPWKQKFEYGMMNKCFLGFQFFLSFKDIFPCMMMPDVTVTSIQTLISDM